MAKTVDTGYREFTPGECYNCGCDADWVCDGRGNVMCSCQACIGCGIIDAYGFHEPGCSVKEEREAETTTLAVCAGDS